ncbi:hypothetical protein L7F22_037589 [Adiantum nelumboides]|nr:hypothetical protein [Adiantum nelumboides]
MHACWASPLVIRGASDARDSEDLLPRGRHPVPFSSTSAAPYSHCSHATTKLVSFVPTAPKRRFISSCKAAIVERGPGVDPAHDCRTSEERVYDVVLRQAALMAKRVSESSPSVLADEKDDISMSDLTLNLTPELSPQILQEAYMRCSEVCAEYAKTFHLGTMLMTPERQRAIWAIYVWCRRTDELVDGPNAPHITPAALNHWEQRLEDLFKGRPYDMLDAALADTVAMFPVDIQPFRDMIEGMRMDHVKTRYENFDELYLYCYYVAGTVGLMSVPVMGIDPQSKATTESVYNAALALGIANQLTNILRDVGEDARRGRIYLPRDELGQFGLEEDDIFAGKVTDNWRAFMKGQIRRARVFFDEAERGVTHLDKDSRWPVWASLILYRQILDSIEVNDYDNFSKRAYVGKWKKLTALPAAYGLALLPPDRNFALGRKTSACI